MLFHSESASALSSRGDYRFPVPGVMSAAVRPGAGGEPQTQHASADGPRGASVVLHAASAPGPLKKPVLRAARVQSRT